VNCDQAGRLVDDYLAEHLGQREHALFEAHLRSCSRCARELRTLPQFERSLRRALVTSVQPLSVSTGASSRLVSAAEESLHKAKRTARVVGLLRFMTATAALALLMVCALFLTGNLAVPSQLQPVALFPASSLPIADLPSPNLSLDAGPLLADHGAIPESAPQVSMLFEPRQMRARVPYTITVFLESDIPRSLESIRLDLDVSGPTGYYRFDLAVEGPLPGRGVSILRLTPDLLAKTCEEQYLMAPSDLFSEAGSYNIRLTFFDAVVDSP
jgi:hypothetical protein